MHELAVCQALIEQVERIARQKSARQVVSIELSIGRLSGVEPKLLEHAYPVASAGTRAANARLVIHTVEPRVRCRNCGSETTVEPNRVLCGACQGWQVDVVAGEEMLLQRVELETLDAPVQ
jgi:hydrogenase nickel incorporation protein HypA/HybF